MNTISLPNHPNLISAKFKIIIIKSYFIYSYNIYLSLLKYSMAIFDDVLTSILGAVCEILIAMHYFFTM